MNLMVFWNFKKFLKIFVILIKKYKSGYWNNIIIQHRGFSIMIQFAVGFYGSVNNSYFFIILCLASELILTDLQQWNIIYMETIYFLSIKMILYWSYLGSGKNVCHIINFSDIWPLHHCSIFNFLFLARKTPHNWRNFVFIYLSLFIYVIWWTCSEFD